MFVDFPYNQRRFGAVCSISTAIVKSAIMIVYKAAFIFKIYCLRREAASELIELD